MITLASEMECGVPSIDSDRTRIIDIYNLAEKTPPETLRSVFTFSVIRLIRSLITSLFIKEEDIMGEVNYPWSLNHKEEHIAMAARFDAQIVEYQLDADPTAIINTLTDFVDSHFLGRDAGLTLAIRMTLAGTRPPLPPGSKRR